MKRMVQIGKMKIFRGIEIIALALLFCPTHGLLEDITNHVLFRATRGTLPGVSRHKDAVIVSDVKNYTQLGTVINFAVNELNKVTAFPFKEQIDEVMEVKETQKNGQLYHMTLRLTQSACEKGNSSCIVDYSTSSNEADPTYTQIIAALEPPMEPGKEIVVKGDIPQNSEGFDITIQTGYERPIEAQLRISVQFSNEGNVLMLKHFEEKAWNLDDHFKGLLERKSTFEVSVTCLSTEYTIFLNGNYLASFRHVEPYQDATHLSVFGEVNITKITGVGPFLPVNKYKPYSAWKNDDIKFAESLIVPFVAAFASPLAPGKNISIKGVVPLISEMFMITIHSGPEYPPDSTVQMRLSSFLDDSNNRTELSHYDGTWHAEEHEQAFTPGHQFHLVITCLNNKFKVSLDGKPFATYDHKILYEKATHLSVHGLVNITEVVGIEKPSLQPFLNTAANTTYSVPLRGLPLTPGRKLNVYIYIPEDSTEFCLDIAGGPENKIFHIHFYPKTEKGFLKWNTMRNYTWETEHNLHSLPWLKPGRPLDIQIRFLEGSFEVIFYQYWWVSFDYRLPLADATSVSLTGNVIVYNIDDGSAVSTQLLPAPSRVCTMSVLTRPAQHDMWLNDLDCIDESLSRSNATLSDEDRIGIAD